MVISNSVYLSLFQKRQRGNNRRNISDMNVVHSCGCLEYKRSEGEALQAIAYNATFWTQDSHFENMKDIKCQRNK
jgi:hypothetical protein